MSILDKDFDADDRIIYRQHIHELILSEVKSCMKDNHTLLLFDPYEEYNLHILRGELKGRSKHFDLAQRKTGDYVTFVTDYVLPFVNGRLNYLCVESIDQIPDIEDKEDFENILRYMAKREDYNPFQNYDAIQGDEPEIIPNVGTINFCQTRGHLIMSCAEPPEFLQNDSYTKIDCRSFVMLVHEYLESTSKDHPLMLIFDGDARECTNRIIECKEWLRGLYNCVNSLGHPFKQGHVHFLDKDGNTQKIADHPELLETAILPVDVTPETEFLLIHRYVDQFNGDALKYAIDVLNEHYLPVIYLVNGYEYNPQINLQGFEKYHLEIK